MEKKKGFFFSLLGPQILLSCHVTHSGPTHQQLCINVCTHNTQTHTHTDTQHTCVYGHTILRNSYTNASVHIRAHTPPGPAKAEAAWL